MRFVVVYEFVVNLYVEVLGVNIIYLINCGEFEIDWILFLLLID